VLAARDHVILCGFGRVGQNIARVLESQGFEFLAIDLDPTRIRLARQAGDPIVFGDSSDEELLRNVGIETASAVIITFANPRFRSVSSGRCAVCAQMCRSWYVRRTMRDRGALCGRRH